MTRHEAIERIQDHIDVHKYREPEAVRILEALDMAIEALKQPEIVRCKDCKYNTGDYKCLNPDSFFVVPADDDFCSYAEGREE